MLLIDWVVLAGYLAILVATMALVRRARNMEDFAVASRGLPAPIVFATMAATYIGPGYSMGLVGKAAEQGYIWFLIFCAFSLQTLIVGFFIAPRIQQFTSARTIGDILAQRYGRFTKFIAGVLTVVLLTGFVGVMVKASADIISTLTDIPFTSAAVLSAIVVISYSTFGGIKADIANDTLQFILLSVAVPVMLALVVWHNGFDYLAEQIPPEALAIGEAFSPAELFGLFLMFFFGEALLPPYTVRALAACEPRAARKGFVLAACFGVAWFFICVSLGVFVHAAAPDVPSTEAFIYAMKTFLPHGLYAVVLCSLVAIILSSWDSLLNCISSAFQSDVLSLLVPGVRQGRAAVALAKGTNVFVGIAATLFAVNVPSLVDALLYCYALWAPTIVLPLAIAVLKRELVPAAGLSAIIGGGLATGLWEWYLQKPWDIPSVVVGLLANQLIFWGVHFLGNGHSLRSTRIPE